MSPRGISICKVRSVGSKILSLEIFRTEIQKLSQVRKGLEKDFVLITTKFFSPTDSNPQTFCIRHKKLSATRWLDIGAALQHRNRAWTVVLCVNRRFIQYKRYCMAQKLSDMVWTRCKTILSYYCHNTILFVKYFAIENILLVKIDKPGD